MNPHVFGRAVMLSTAVPLDLDYAAADRSVPNWKAYCGVVSNRELNEKKLIISQSIMWAVAILVVSIVEEKEFAVSMLVLLATISLINLRKGK